MEIVLKLHAKHRYVSIGRFTCPKLAVLLTVFFSNGSFFANLRKNKGFQLDESPYFYVSQQKKKKLRAAPKELLKRTVFFLGGGDM